MSAYTPPISIATTTDSITVIRRVPTHGTPSFTKPYGSITMRSELAVIAYTFTPDGLRTSAICYGPRLKKDGTDSPTTNRADFGSRTEPTPQWLAELIDAHRPDEATMNALLAPHQG